MILEASKPQPSQSGSRDKFAPLVSLLAPYLIHTWPTVLQAVSRSLLIDASKPSPHFGHYTFLDPGLFISPASDERKAKFIEMWLQAREAWIVRVAHEASLAMSGQSWPNFLVTNRDSFSETKDTKAAKHHQHILDIITFSDPEVKL